MRRSRTTVPAAAGVAALWCCVGAYPAAACFQHTFEPCPASASRDYVVELDRTSGRTWLKERPANTGSVERMARLAATAAQNFADRQRPAAVPAADGARQPGWETRVSPVKGRVAKD